MLKIKGVAVKNILNYLLVKDFLKNVAGEESLTLVKHCINKKKNISDEYLAKKMKLKVTEIRAILNRLHYRGIVYYKKSKNHKTGWYSYTWDIKPERIAELILEEEMEKIEKLEKTREFEKNYVFFGCKKAHDLLPFEIASEYEFKCPACGNSMDSIDNEKHLKHVQERIDGLRKEIIGLQKIK